MGAVLSSFWLAVLTVAVGTFVVVTSPLLRLGGWVMSAGRCWSRWVLRGAGVRAHYAGLENIRSVGPALFMANHQSLLDIPAVCLVMPDHLHFVAKKSLRWMPFLGWAMMASGVGIFVDRKKRAKAIVSLRQAAEQIRQGSPVLIFPEGTRSLSGKLQDFKKGPFYLAAEARVPIVPIGIRGTHTLMPPGSWTIRSGDIDVLVGKPIAVEADDDPARISQRVHKAMVELLGTKV